MCIYALGTGNGYLNLDVCSGLGWCIQGIAIVTSPDALSTEPLTAPSREEMIIKCLCYLMAISFFSGNRSAWHQIKP
jgi:hypothetical protein